jgi:hypothetical protein
MLHASSTGRRYRREGFARYPALLGARSSAVVIRHRRQRDADNTWHTWINALCGASRTDHDHWAAYAPLAGCRLPAVASVLDPSVDTPVLYELWA